MNSIGRYLRAKTEAVETSFDRFDVLLVGFCLVSVVSMARTNTVNFIDFEL